MDEDSSVRQGAARDCGAGHGSVVCSVTKDSDAQGGGGGGGGGCLFISVLGNCKVPGS